MDFFDTIPDNIKAIIGKKTYSVDSIGMSDSTVITFDDVVLKTANHSKTSDSTIELMRWLGGKLPVPEVIHYEVKDGKSYLLMSKIKGKMCCDDFYLEHADKMAEQLVKGLKMLQSIDISDCPRRCDLDSDLAEARYNVDNGIITSDKFKPESFEKENFETPHQLLQWLEENRPDEKYVLSHGDYCLPNVFLDNGSISGFVDLEHTGIADIHRDIATCYRSLKNNFNGTFGGKVRENFDPGILFEKLEMKVDMDKVRYYMLLEALL